MSVDKNLIALRRAIRFGFVEEASSLLKSSRNDSTQWQVESGFLDLLTFSEPQLYAFETTDLETQCRALLLEGIFLNRKRDPLGALAKLEQSINLARSFKDQNFHIDVLRETARVYSWLGNAPESLDRLVQALSIAEDDESRFLIFYRLAELYAELERWSLALKYIEHASTYSSGMGPSIYWAQVLECHGRICLALGLDPSMPLGQLRAVEKTLPGYLQFKLQCLVVEQALQNGDQEMTARELKALHALPLCQNPNSFESTIAGVFSARLDLSQNLPLAAIPKLEHARKWFVDEDLAVRLVDSQILLAKAYAQSDDLNKAAAELEIARNYCNSRGLRLHVEKVEGCFTALNLALYPVVERHRTSSSSGWKNRQAYVILEKLGEGGQGSVFRAHDNARGKIVALKKLKSTSATALNSMAREVRAANAAVVPNVARVIACGQEEDGSLYIVQDFISGQSLRQVMAQRATPAKILEHIRSVAQTLSQLHAKTIVHGDVKPDNVIITPDGEAILVDFGVARIVGDAAKATDGATARYAPPAFAAKFRAAAWRDEYAIGLMVQETLGEKLLPQPDVNMDVAQALIKDLLSSVRFSTQAAKLWPRLLA
jgi:predicted Ser/Thr protein kinase